MDGGTTWKELDEKSAKGASCKTLGARCRYDSAIKTKCRVCHDRIDAQRTFPFRRWRQNVEERDRSNWMVWRPFYFSNLIVDPKNENNVYKPDLTLIMSEDGGKSFSGIGNGAHGDFHDVWVNPTIPIK